VFEHIAVLFYGRVASKSLHKQLGLGDDTAQLPVVGFAMSQNEPFMAGMKVNQRSDRLPLLGASLPAMIGKNSLNEVFA
jgi:hypothetical protein